MIRSTALFTADKPMVSICCSTFNHENFIGEALDGFLMQKCDFPVEILIHEDCSTDNTAVIIKEYQQKFSDIIKPKFQKENQYSKGVKPISQLLLPRSQGKYIALCEGDDYWTDPYKLQNQVDFLEANEDFAICHHNMQVIYEENNNKPHLSNPPDGEKFTTIETLAHGNYIYTASCVFRDGLFGEFPNWFAKCPIGDYPLHMLNAQFGKIRYFPEIMGVYRVHNGGVWESKDPIYRKKKWVDLLDQMKNQFSDEINQLLIDKQNRDSEELILISNKQPEQCRKYSNKLLENNPFYVSSLKSENLRLTTILEQKNQELKQKNQELNLKNIEIDQKNQELNNIITSKSWKLIEFVRNKVPFIVSILKLLQLIKYQTRRNI